MTTNVATTASCRGHPEPRKRKRRPSKSGLLKVRATPSQLARWQDEADHRRLPLSEFVRTKLDDEPFRVKSTADPALLVELKRHGNNLNQLLAVIHSDRRIVRSELVEAVLGDLQTLYHREIARA